MLMRFRGSARRVKADALTTSMVSSGAAPPAPAPGPGPAPAVMPPAPRHRTPTQQNTPPAGDKEKMSNSSPDPASKHNNKPSDIQDVIVQPKNMLKSIRIPNKQNKLITSKASLHKVTLPGQGLTSSQSEKPQGGDSYQGRFIHSQAVMMRLKGIDSSTDIQPPRLNAIQPQNSTLMKSKNRIQNLKQSLQADVTISPLRNVRSQGIGTIIPQESGTLQGSGIIRLPTTSQGSNNTPLRSGTSHRRVSESPLESVKSHESDTTRVLGSSTSQESCTNDQSTAFSQIRPKSDGDRKRKTTTEYTTSVKKNKVNTKVINFPEKASVDMFVKTTKTFTPPFDSLTHYFDPINLNPSNPNIISIKVIYNFERARKNVNTVAKFTTKDGQEYQHTSENVANLIGHENYHRLHTILCSLKKELFEQAMLLLLTPRIIQKDDKVQTGKEDKAIMTELTPSYPILRQSKKRRYKTRRKRLQPYIMKNFKPEPKTLSDSEHPVVKINKLKITKNLEVNSQASYEHLKNADAVSTSPKCTVEMLKTTPTESLQQSTAQLSDSAVGIPNDSTEQRFSDNLSDKISYITGWDRMSISTSVIVNNLMDSVIFDDDALLQMENISDDVTMPEKKNAQLITPIAGMAKSVMGTDKSAKIHNNYKPEIVKNAKAILENVGENNIPDSGETDRGEMFNNSLCKLNLASPEHLKNMTDAEKKNMAALQMYLDWKNCLLPDEENNLPIHNAVLDGDFDMLKRQCFVLKAKNQSIDIGDGSNNSPLQMAVWKGSNIEFVQFLLDLGADPLRADDEERTCLHLCAETQNYEYTEVVLQYMANHPRECLERADLWKPDLEHCKQDKVKNYLSVQAIGMFDSRGHTPVMAAARLGHYENLMRMLEDIFDTASIVNKRMETCGYTALYLAVDATCLEAQRRCDRSTVPPNYASTIEMLIRFGANPWIETFSGYTVNKLTTDLNYGFLWNFICEKLSKNKFRPLMPSIPAYFEEESLPEMPRGVVEPLILIKSGNGTINYEMPKHKRHKSGKARTNEIRLTGIKQFEDQSSLHSSNNKTETKIGSCNIQKDLSVSTPKRNLSNMNNEGSLHTSTINSPNISSNTSSDTVKAIDRTNFCSQNKQMALVNSKADSNNFEGSIEPLVTKLEVVNSCIENMGKDMTSDPKLPNVKVCHNKNVKIIKLPKNPIIIKKRTVAESKNEKPLNLTAEPKMLDINQINSTSQVSEQFKQTIVSHNKIDSEITKSTLENAKQDQSKPIILENVPIDATSILRNLKFDPTMVKKSLQEQTLTSTGHKKGEILKKSTSIGPRKVYVDDILKPSPSQIKKPEAVNNKGDVPKSVSRMCIVEPTIIKEIKQPKPVVKNSGPFPIKLSSKNIKFVKNIKILQHNTDKVSRMAIEKMKLDGKKETIVHNKNINELLNKQQTSQVNSKVSDLSKFTFSKTNTEYNNATGAISINNIDKIGSNKIVPFEPKNYSHGGYFFSDETSTLFDKASAPTNVSIILTGLGKNYVTEFKNDSSNSTNAASKPSNDASMTPNDVSKSTNDFSKRTNYVTKTTVQKTNDPSTSTNFSAHMLNEANKNSEQNNESTSHSKQGMSNCKKQQNEIPKKSNTIDDKNFKGFSERDKHDEDCMC